MTNSFSISPLVNSQDLLFLSKIWHSGRACLSSVETVFILSLHFVPCEHFALILYPLCAVSSLYFVLARSFTHASDLQCTRTLHPTGSQSNPQIYEDQLKLFEFSLARRKKTKCLHGYGNHSV